MPSRATLHLPGAPPREFHLAAGERVEILPGILLEGSEAPGIVVECTSGELRMEGRRQRPGDRQLLLPGREAAAGAARIAAGWDDPGTAVEARAVLLAALRGAAPPGGSELVALRGPAAGRRFPLRSGVLGRGSGSAVRIDDPSVSRRHARIEVEGDRVRVADLRSRNGSWLGPERLSTLRELRPGDEFRAGRTVLTLGILAEVPAPVPAAPTARPVRRRARAALLAAAGASIAAALLVLG